MNILRLQFFLLLLDSNQIGIPFEKDASINVFTNIQVNLDPSKVYVTKSQCIHNRFFIFTFRLRKIFSSQANLVVAYIRYPMSGIVLHFSNWLSTRSHFLCLTREQTIRFFKNRYLPQHGIMTVLRVIFFLSAHFYSWLTSPCKRLINLPSLPKIKRIINNYDRQQRRRRRLLFNR